MTTRFVRFSAAFSLLMLGTGVLLLLYEPWLVFLPLALWIGGLQVGSL